jgi:hypothetical protein
VERLVPRGVEPGGAEFPHLRQQRLAQLAPLHLAVADVLAHGGGFRALHHGAKQLGFLVQAREGHAVPVDQHHVGALAHCQRARMLAEGGVARAPPTLAMRSIWPVPGRLPAASRNTPTARGRCSRRSRASRAA